MCIGRVNFLKVLQSSLSGSLGSLLSIKAHQEKSTSLCINLNFLKSAHKTFKYYEKTVHEQHQSNWTRFIKMLTCSLTFLFASNSLCNLSALSSEASVFSCKSLIFRLTASSDVAPAIVPTTVGFERGSRCAISDRRSSDEVTSSIVRKLSGDAQSECLLFVQEVPFISKCSLF